MSQRPTPGLGTGPPTNDGWVFSVLLTGGTPNGEVDRVSDALRPFARRMAAAPADGRAALWATLLEILPPGDADSLVQEVASADPAGPPPDGDTWPPLRLGELPAVPDFPLDVLPVAVADFVTAAAAAVGCDPAMVAGPVLPVAGGLIGRSASLLRGANWFAPASVFYGNVALPGDGKSPALGYVTEPVSAIDRVLADDFLVQKLAYQQAAEEYERAKKQKEAAVARPNPPVPVRVNIDDTTMEAVFRVLAANLRGLLMVRDELSALILSLNQYKGGVGSDRSNLLKTWSGAPVLIDRVRNEFGEPIRIPHPHLCITGNFPPAMLAEMVNRRGDDGMIDRWLLCFPDRRRKLKAAERRPVPTEVLSRWSEVAHRLWSRPMDHDGGSARPHVIYFSNAAKAEFDRRYDLHVDEVNAADFPDDLRGPWAKLEEYAGRLCLILTLLRHAADPTADPAALPSVDATEAANAWRLVDFFKAHHRRVRAYLGGRGVGGAPEGVRAVQRWLRNHPSVETFPESELTRDIPMFRKDGAALMEDALGWLEARRALRRRPDPDRPKGTRGRKPAPVWEVHPHLRDRLRDSGFSGNSGNGPRHEPGGDSDGDSPNTPNSPNPEGGVS